MDMITAEEVIRRIELYFVGGSIGYLRPEFRSMPVCVREALRRVEEALGGVTER